MLNDRNSLTATTLALVFAGTCLVGCSGGGRNVTVKGKVLLNDAPLEGATVTFHGEGGNLAVTNEQGEFAIEGKTKYDTIKPGEYIVLVSKMVDKKGKVADKEELDQLVAAGLAKEIVPYRFSHIEGSKLRATIKEGENILPPFELKSR